MGTKFVFNGVKMFFRCSVEVKEFICLSFDFVITVYNFITGYNDTNVPRPSPTSLPGTTPKGKCVSYNSKIDELYSGLATLLLSLQFLINTNIPRQNVNISCCCDLRISLILLVLTRIYKI